MCVSDPRPNPPCPLQACSFTSGSRRSCWHTAVLTTPPSTPPVAVRRFAITLRGGIGNIARERESERAAVHSSTCNRNCIPMWRYKILWLVFLSSVSAGITRPPPPPRFGVEGEVPQPYFPLSEVQVSTDNVTVEFGTDWSGPVIQIETHPPPLPPPPSSPRVMILSLGRAGLNTRISAFTDVLWPGLMDINLGGDERSSKEDST